MSTPPVGTGGTNTGPGFEGCSALCVSSTHLVVSGLKSGELFSNAFEACRNGECYRGAFDAASSSNTIALTGGTGDETTVWLFYEAPPKLTLHLNWALQVGTTGFVDGDHYTLRTIEPAGFASTLIDTLVTYEPRTICGSECSTAYVPDLQRPIEAAGGAASE